MPVSLPVRPQRVALLTTMLSLSFAGTSQAAITISSPANQAYVNDTTPAVTFTGATPNAEVDLEVGGNPAGSVVADAGGAGTIEATAPATGSTSLLVRDTDTSEQDAVVAYLDRVPSLSGTSEGSKVEASDVHFAASSAIPDGLVRLYVDSRVTPVFSATADADGAVTDADGDFVSIAPTLAPGPHTAYLVTVDDQGRESTAATVTFDVAPPRPTFTQLFDEARVNRSAVPVALSGVVADADAVTLYELDDEAVLHQVATAADPSTTPTVTLTLPAGRHTLYVSQTVDGVEGLLDGNGGTVTVDVKTSPPVLDELVTPTEDARPWFSASNLLVNSAQNDTKVVLYVDGQEVARDDDFGGGTDVLRPAADLAAGTHTAYVTTIDDLGHEGAPSNTVAFTITAPPVITPDPTPTPTPAPTPSPTLTPIPTPTPAPAPAPTLPAPPTKVGLSSRTLTSTKPVKLGFTLSAPGTVKVTISKGKRPGGKVVTSLAVKVKKAGKGQVTLRTKNGGRTLTKGTYTVSVQTFAGGVLSAPVIQQLRVA